MPGLSIVIEAVCNRWTVQNRNLEGQASRNWSAHFPVLRVQIFRTTEYPQHDIHDLHTVNKQGKLFPHHPDIHFVSGACPWFLYLWFLTHSPFPLYIPCYLRSLETKEERLSFVSIITGTFSSLIKRMAPLFEKSNYEPVKDSEEFEAENRARFVQPSYEKPYRRLRIINVFLIFALVLAVTYAAYVRLHPHNSAALLGTDPFGFVPPGRPGES